MQLYCFLWATFIIHLTKICLETFFSPLKHTQVPFYAGISRTESLDVCGNFTHVKKKRWKKVAGEKKISLKILILHFLKLTNICKKCAAVGNSKVVQDVSLNKILFLVKGLSLFMLLTSLDIKNLCPTEKVTDNFCKCSTERQLSQISETDTAVSPEWCQRMMTQLLMMMTQLLIV